MLLKHILHCLFQATLGDMEPQDVQYAPGANKELVLRVPDSVTR